MAKRNEPADAQARLDSLVERLARVDRDIAGANLADVDGLAENYALQSALQRAIETLRSQIAEEARNDAQRARLARDEAQQARELAARAQMVDLARRMAVDIPKWTWVQDYDAAAQELQRCGAILPLEAAPVANLRRAVAQGLEAWRSSAPEWVGLPKPPSQREQALAEAQKRVAEWTAKLDAARVDSRRGRRHGEVVTVTQESLARIAGAVQSHRVILYRLEQPDEADHERIVRSYAGLNEISEQLGVYLERYNDGIRAEQYKTVGDLLVMA